jgi:hypothetical protein
LRGRKCHCCISPNLTQIDEALKAGTETLQSIADSFNVSLNSVYYHRTKHLGILSALPKPKEDEEVLTPEELEWCKKNDEYPPEKRPTCPLHPQNKTFLHKTPEGVWVAVCPKCKTYYPLEGGV